MSTYSSPMQDPALEEEQREEESEKLKKKIRRSEKSVKRYQFFLLQLIIILVVLWILFFKVIGLTHMPNEDMYPRVDAGDMVMFYRLDRDVQAQDLIAFEKAAPGSDEEKLYISRVIAAPGDTVEITDDGILLVNGNAVSEPGIFYSTKPYEGYTAYPVTLGQDECFVLADRREGGTDSRYFGPVQKKEILGTVITIFRRNRL